MATAPLPPSSAEISTGTPQAAPLSEVDRVINTFIAPSKTFTDIRRSASWWLPYLIIVVFSMLFMFAVDHKIGFEQVTKNEIARAPKRAAQLENLPPDQRAQQIRGQIIGTRVVSYCIAVLIIVFQLIFAGIYMGVFNLVFNAGIAFKRYLAIVVYAGLPGIIHLTLAIISLFAGVDPEGFNINNPVGSNPSYFMDPMGNKFLYVLASGVDPFIWWGIILTGVGIACNSKVKRTTAIVVIGAMYLAYKLAGAGIAAALS
jgi:hypothetical protein